MTPTEQMFDAQQIIEQSEKASRELPFNDDDIETPRFRLAFQVGYLTGHIKTLCHYIKFIEGELNEANAMIDRLKT